MCIHTHTHTLKLKEWMPYIQGHVQNMFPSLWVNEELSTRFLIQIFTGYRTGDIFLDEIVYQTCHDISINLKLCS